MSRLPVLNETSAHFECVYPTCGGECCKNGRPSLEVGEHARIDGALERVLPRMRPSARRVVERSGYLSRRRRSGKPMLAIKDGYCVFFNEGCTLHALGAEEGDRWRYKPWQCITFPYERDGEGSWYVRQWGYRGEQSDDLFCLNPKESPKLALSTLGPEAEFAARLEGPEERWRFEKP